jgi:hypothetical protein
LGYVQVDTLAGADVWIDGHHIGRAPLADVPVSIGTREVLVRHAERGERRYPVRVRQGEVAVVAARLDAGISPADAAASMPSLTAPSLQIIR